MKNLFARLVVACALVATAQAQVATYTFESAQFALNSLSPFFNKSPDYGLGTFRASFTSSPNPSAFFAGGTQFPPTLTGKNLMDGTGPFGGNTLHVSFNMPVNQVYFDFALFVPGRLDFSSPSGNTSANTPDLSQVGSLFFQSSLAFSQFDLVGFGPSDNQVSLAIDNLAFTIVPEPSTASLLGLGLGACGLLVIQRRAVPPVVTQGAGL
jgi:hypothetical protein